MSNIYLNELDRFMKHELKPLAYLRYGDDWLCFASSNNQINDIRGRAQLFLKENLSLTINPKIDYIQKSHNGISYLGVDIWPSGRRLQLEVQKRISTRLTKSNAPSYSALVSTHEKSSKLRLLDWILVDFIDP